MTSIFDPQSQTEHSAENESYSFSLHISGAEEATEDLANALFAAGCTDAIFGECDGQVSLDFERFAPDFAAAIQTAIADVEKVPGLSVTEVLQEGAGVIAEVNAILKARSVTKKNSLFKKLLGD